MRVGIGARAIAGVALVIAVTVAVTTLLGWRAQEAAGIAQLRRSGDQLGETIKSSTQQNMMENHRDRLREQIETIGRQAGIETIRIYNKEGRVVFSSDPQEVGRAVDKRAEACDACHAAGRPLDTPAITERSRVFSTSEGRRVLGVITPIENAPGCATAACHAHDPRRTVLGVLDVTVSLDALDRETARSRQLMVVLAVVAIAASSAILWWFNRRLVVHPVAALVTATEHVAQGDLSTRVPAGARHELGELARSFNDMTARLADAQRQLAQADKLASLGRLAAGVAHEINNPLTGVLTYSSFLLKRAQGNPELAADLEVVVRETQRCRDIVRGLLDFARQVPTKRESVDLNETARRAAAILANPLALDRTALTLDLASDIPTVHADPGQMEQVLINLLMNAADAVGPDGRIRVSTSARRGEEARAAVELVVEDNGHGISEADRQHIFDPFFTTKGTRGTGLGLSVTWGIVAAHGGTIAVESAVGEGSRFTVRLPAEVAA